MMFPRQFTSNETPNIGAHSTRSAAANAQISNSSVQANQDLYSGLRPDGNPPPFYDTPSLYTGGPSYTYDNYNQYEARMNQNQNSMM